MNHIKRQEVIFILIICTFVIGGIWFYSGSTLMSTLYGYDGDVIAITDKHEAYRGDSAPRAPNIRKNFENSLNDFLKQTYTRMRDYRRERKILEDLIAPENLRKPGYIAENYALSQQIIASLEAQMKGVITVFERKDQEITKLIQKQPKKTQQIARRSWEDLRNKEYSKFMQHFIIEEDILGLYGDLITFYHTKRASMVYDYKTNQMRFQNPTDQDKQKHFLDGIKTLKDQQSALLKSP